MAEYAGKGFFVCRIFAKFAFYSWLAGWWLPLLKQSFSVHLKRTGEEVLHLAAAVAAKDKHLLSKRSWQDHPAYSSSASTAIQKMFTADEKWKNSVFEEEEEDDEEE